MSKEHAHNAVEFLSNPSVETWWPLWCSLWFSIGCDYGFDILWWIATGESLRGRDHGPVDQKDRERVRREFERAFENFKDLETWPWQVDKNQE